jgi:hypothetical protein
MGWSGRGEPRVKVGVEYSKGLSKRLRAQTRYCMLALVFWYVKMDVTSAEQTFSRALSDTRILRHVNM